MNRIYLFLMVIVAFMAIGCIGTNITNNDTTTTLNNNLSSTTTTINQNNKTNLSCEVYFFYSPTCPHCQNEKPFLKMMENENPSLDVKFLVASKNVPQWKTISQRHNTTPGPVPMTFVGDKAFVGYSEEAGNLTYAQQYKAYIGHKNQLRDTIKDCLQD